MFRLILKFINIIEKKDNEKNNLDDQGEIANWENLD